uniref:RNase H domain-containing protein n=1 Tax=Meloidogyne hapla TaxID=6305 RepID=A0A1I8BJA7_MELHA
MAPHKSKLSKMDERTQQAHIHIVNVKAHNSRYENERKKEKGAVDDDTALSKISKRNTQKNWFGKLLRRHKQKSHQIPVQYTPGFDQKRHDSPTGYRNETNSLKTQSILNKILLKMQVMSAYPIIKDHLPEVHHSIIRLANQDVTTPHMVQLTVDLKAVHSDCEDIK